LAGTYLLADSSRPATQPVPTTSSSRATAREEASGTWMNVRTAADYLDLP